MKRISCLYHLLVLFLVGLDQLSKFLIVKFIYLYQKVEIIPGFFSLTRIHNRGVIFGAFSHLQQPAARIILAIVSLLALVIVFIFYLKTPLTERMVKLSFSLILAGAIGNLLDRLIRGYVVDFIDLHIGRHHWPFFNLADTCITLGGVMLIVFLFIPQRRKECSPSS